MALINLMQLETPPSSMLELPARGLSLVSSTPLRECPLLFLKLRGFPVRYRPVCEVPEHIAYDERYEKSAEDQLPEYGELLTFLLHLLMPVLCMDKRHKGYEQLKKESNPPHKYSNHISPHKGKRTRALIKAINALPTSWVPVRSIRIEQPVPWLIRCHMSLLHRVILYVLDSIRHPLQLRL